jgi:hypothetical protein
MPVLSRLSNNVSNSAISSGAIVKQAIFKKLLPLRSEAEGGLTASSLEASLGNETAWK